MPNLNVYSSRSRASNENEYRRAVEQAALVLEVKLSPAAERTLETDPEKRTAALLLGVMRKSAEVRRETSAGPMSANFDSQQSREANFRRLEKLEEVKRIFSSVSGLKAG